MSQKSDFQNAAGAEVNLLLITNSQDIDKAVSGNCFVWSFLTETKQDQAFPSHGHGKIWHRSTKFRLRFLCFSSILKVIFPGYPVCA